MCISRAHWWTTAVYRCFVMRVLCVNWLERSSLSNCSTLRPAMPLVTRCHSNRTWRNRDSPGRDVMKVAQEVTSPSRRSLNNVRVWSYSGGCVPHLTFLPHMDFCIRDAEFTTFGTDERFYWQMLCFCIIKPHLYNSSYTLMIKLVRNPEYSGKWRFVLFSQQVSWPVLLISKCFLMIIFLICVT